MASYTPGAKCYVQIEGAWKEAEVGACAGGKVTTVAGDTVDATKDVATYSAQASQGVSDMINLDVLHSASILHNLSTRFFRDEIYTYGEYGACGVPRREFRLPPSLPSPS